MWSALSRYLKLDQNYEIYFSQHLKPPRPTHVCFICRIGLRGGSLTMENSTSPEFKLFGISERLQLCKSLQYSVGLKILFLVSFPLSLYHKVMKFKVILQNTIYQDFHFIRIYILHNSPHSRACSGERKKYCFVICFQCFSYPVLN